MQPLAYQCKRLHTTHATLLVRTPHTFMETLTAPSQEVTKGEQGITEKDFGKDHWSLLAYVEYRAVNHDGQLNIQHMRTKNPVIATTTLGQNFWVEEDSTKLFGFWNEDGTTNPDRKLKNHDDHDCLDDLEKAGLIKDVGTMINPFALLTKKGSEVCGEMALWKSEGKHYSTFSSSL